jgi:hypothetical protein
LRVLNRGIGGEDAREMLARFERDVLAQKPDLLLWQLGTNVLVQDLVRRVGYDRRSGPFGGGMCDMEHKQRAADRGCFVKFGNGPSPIM